MEELVIFRIFASFPLFGLLLPDISSLFIYPAKSISATHLYIEGFLLVAVSICTGGIWYHQKQGKSSNSSIQMAGTN
ncbi:MAG: hypothetical protein AAGC65_08300 [Mucilaginibacter sp.]|uniref:hypothetical protein n=1 Tax=Mucilaginibacter sp. TaxID=1882438 RepID=UPI0031AC5B23